MKRKLIAKKPFEFSARVTLQLGRESISSSTVALSELIKNAYDADADKVTLDFILREHSISALIISDDGIGMEPDTLMDNWLKIGTDNKSISERSENKRRVLTGAKGLGRLGIDRLCKKLILYTKTENMDKAIQLNVDWKRFENTKLNLSDIEHDIYEVSLPLLDKYGEFFSSERSSGTRMILLGLKDNWNEKFLETLENELNLLVSPFQGENQFGIDLIIRRKNEVVTKTLDSTRVLDAARWKVTAEIDSNGDVEVCYTNNRKKIDIVQDKIAWKNWIKNSGESPEFGPVRFEFYYFSQNTLELSSLNLKSMDMKKFLRLNQGVRIYRDYFRVRPYGEPTGKGDWLDLGLRKAGSPGGISQQGWRIGPNQIVGSTFISRETNSLLEDQANREGIVENDAFFKLRTFLLKVIETFEILVQKDVSGDKQTDLSEELGKILAKSNSDIEDAIKNLRDSIHKRKHKNNKKKSLFLNQEKIVSQKLHELETLKEKQNQAELEYLEALQNEKKLLEEQKNTLSNLASIGILTVSFGHEVRQHAGIALNASSRVIKYLNEITNNDSNIDKAKQFSQMIKNSTKYIDNFSRFALENIKPDKRKRKKIDIPSVFQYVFSMFDATLVKMNVKTELKIVDNKKFEIYAFEIDWESIVINLMTNSIWAIESCENRENSKIVVEFHDYNDEFLIQYKDSGIGLETGAEESIFLPMNSGKRDRTGNSIGTGMGLAIVKTHIEEHMGGNITAIAHSDITGALFEIRLPKGDRK